MGSGFSKLKKQARMMEQQFAEMQEQMQATKVEGKSAGDFVKVILNGEKKLEKIEINPECVDPSDIEGLQDLILSAFEDAHEKIEESQPDAGGMNLPFNLPFPT